MSQRALRDGSNMYQLIVSMDGIFGSGNIAKARPGTDEEVLRRNIGRLLLSRMKSIQRPTLPSRYAEGARITGRSSGTSTTGSKTPTLTLLSSGMRLSERTRTQCGQSPANTSTITSWLSGGPETL